MQVIWIWVSSAINCLHSRDLQWKVFRSLSLFFRENMSRKIEKRLFWGDIVIFLNFHIFLTPILKICNEIENGTSTIVGTSLSREVKSFLVQEMKCRAIHYLFISRFDCTTKTIILNRRRMCELNSAENVGGFDKSWLNRFRYAFFGQFIEKHTYNQVLW